MMYTITDKPKRYKRQYNVYKISNDIDNMIYVGTTTTELWHRMSQHRADARKGEKSPLYEHMRLLGVEHFKIQLVCNTTPEMLRSVEESIISSIPTEYRLNYKRTCKNDVSKKYDYDEIITMYRKIGSISGTAKAIGCSRVTVKKAIRKLLLDL